MESQITELKKFVSKEAEKRNLSLRQVAVGIGVSPSYLSEVLNGKKSFGIEFCNAIADFFNVQRTFLYNLVGWVKLNSDEVLVDQFREYSLQNPEFAEFVRMVLELDNEVERKRLIRVIRAGLSN